MQVSEQGARLRLPLPLGKGCGEGGLPQLLTEARGFEQPSGLCGHRALQSQRGAVGELREQLGPAVHAEVAIEVANVVVHGVRAAVEVVGDVTFAKALQQQVEHLAGPWPKLAQARIALGTDVGVQGWSHRDVQQVHDSSIAAGERRLVR